MCMLMAEATKGPTSVHVQRVNQLDAGRIDDELLNLLFAQAKSCFRYFPSVLVEGLVPELRAVLRLFFFANTIAVHVPSPGNDYQNVRYRSELPSKIPRTRFGAEGTDLTLGQRIAYFAIDLLLPYVWERVRRHATENEWGQDQPLTWRHMVWRGMDAAETVTRVLELANFCAFLRHGRYRSLTGRILRARLIYQDVAVTRQANFEFLNRQLVWQGFADFLLFLTPLLSTARAARWLTRTRLGRRLLARPPSRSANSSALGARATASCHICGSSAPVMPHAALPCRHMFCYACVAAALETDPSYRCESCDVAVHSLERVTAQ